MPEAQLLEIVRATIVMLSGSEDTKATMVARSRAFRSAGLPVGDIRKIQGLGDAHFRHG
ncbi:hypothetical protein NKI38_07830 [Mesorhizobium sp. M0621]|uniref:hypothetical protein n=1 Tax=Mesorhizobium sp. M0621 TaxID=2956974 RepID=UPI00333A72CA